MKLGIDYLSKVNWGYYIITLSVLIYVFIANFIDRISSGTFINTANFYYLIGAELILFALLAALFHSKGNDQKEKILITSILFRLPFLLIVPNLSDDFYRFIWDGILWNEGINPFSILPKEFMETYVQASDNQHYLSNLYDNLNSKNYYTVYPAIPQCIFYISTLIGGNSVLVSVIIMRIIISVIEIIGINYLLKLLRFFQIKGRYALLFALNPLLIIETTGNLHHEGIMISFLIIAIYQLAVRKNLFLGSMFFAFSVATKLLPLILIPLFFKQFGIKKNMQFLLRLMLFSILLFLPILASQTHQNFLESIDLYFQKFEFNASIYYLVRWIGKMILGYNPIQIIGPALSFISILAILYVAIKSKKNSWESFFQSALASFSIYYFLSPIVHPWYIINLSFLCIFTRFRFPLVWSFLVVLTYATYLRKNYEEILILTTIEYGIVILLLVYEGFNLSIKNKNKTKVLKLYKYNQHRSI